jgi:hypothetical protein
MSNLPRAPTRSGDSIEGRLIFVIVAQSTVSTTGRVELTSLASIAQVTRSVSSLTGMFESNPILSLVMGSAKPSCGIPLLLNPPSNRFPLNGDFMGSAIG